MPPDRGRRDDLNSFGLGTTQQWSARTTLTETSTARHKSVYRASKQGKGTASSPSSSARPLEFGPASGSAGPKSKVAAVRPINAVGQSQPLPDFKRTSQIQAEKALAKSNASAKPAQPGKGEEKCIDLTSESEEDEEEDPYTKSIVKLDTAQRDRGTDYLFSSPSDASAKKRSRKDGSSKQTESPLKKKKRKLQEKSSKASESADAIYDDSFDDWPSSSPRLSPAGPMQANGQALMKGSSQGKVKKKMSGRVLPESPDASQVVLSGASKEAEEARLSQIKVKRKMTQLNLPPSPKSSKPLPDENFPDVIGTPTLSKTPSLDVMNLIKQQVSIADPHSASEAVRPNRMARSPSLLASGSISVESSQLGPTVFSIRSTPQLTTESSAPARPAEHATPKGRAYRRGDRKISKTASEILQEYMDEPSREAPATVRAKAKEAGKKRSPRLPSEMAETPRKLALKDENSMPTVKKRKARDDQSSVSSSGSCVSSLVSSPSTIDLENLLSSNKDSSRPRPKPSKGAMRASAAQEQESQPEKQRPKARPSKGALLASSVKAAASSPEGTGAGRKTKAKRIASSSPSPSPEKPRNTRFPSVEDAGMLSMVETESSDSEYDGRKYDSPDIGHFASTQHLWLNAVTEGRDIDDMSEHSESQNQNDAEEADDEGDADYEGPRCPFCDGPLPARPSQTLLVALSKLCLRPDIRLRKGSTNPYALKLSVVNTSSACKRHRDETTIVPEGLNKGYPAEESIDWAALPSRFLQLCFKDMRNIVMGLLESSFAGVAKEEWKARGARAMANVLNEWTSFEQELPGYYGHRGFEEIIRILQTELIETHILNERRTFPLDIDSYLRRVMVPEVAVRLIQDDRGGCSSAEAMRILSESRAYGSAVFPSTGGTDLEETKAEKRERQKEEREEEKQRQEILDKGGSRAEALQRGQDAIMFLRQFTSH